MVVVVVVVVVVAVAVAVVVDERNASNAAQPVRRTGFLQSISLF